MGVFPPKSLLWRIGLSIMLVQVVVATMLGIYGYFTARSFYYDQTLAELMRANSLLVERYRPLFLDSDTGTLQKFVQDDSQRTDMRITVILPDGRVVAESHTDAKKMENHRYRPEIDSALTYGSGIKRRYSNTLQQDMLYYADRVGSSTEAVGVVRSALSLEKATIAFSRVARVIGTAGFVTVLLTLVIVYLISRHLTRQVAAIASGSQRFAAGDLAHRIHQPPSSELAHLADSINEMARQMSSRIKQAERQERETNAILQSMSNGVIALDAEQRILSMNRVALTMFDLIDVPVTGKLLQEIVREPGLHGFVNQAILTSEMQPIEFELVRDDRARIQATGELLKSSKDKAHGLVVVLQDVTRLRQLESMRSDFAANVSHELRTPITNIKGYVETLLDIGVGNLDQTRRFLEIIRQNAERLAAIVEDVLSLTRLENERVEEILEKHATRLQESMMSVVSQFAERADAKSIRIDLQINQDLIVEVHAHLIEQAVGNLISNAINYSPPHTTVTVSATENPRGEVVIAVRDEGCGIAHADVPRLFERFYRVDKGRSRELGGTGLGLAIVKHIMNVHGGRVEVESDIGNGSTFSLIFSSLG